MISVLFLLGLTLTTVQAQECIKPDKLVFSVVPTDKKSLEINVYEPFIDAIADRVDIPVERQELYSYEEVITHLLQGTLHFARLGSFSYVTAVNLGAPIEPFAVHYHASHPPFQKEGPFYNSILIVNADSPYHDVASLRGKTLLLTEQGSTSGVLVPHIAFTKTVQEAKLGDFFASIMYSGGHDTSILNIANKAFDAAFVSTRNLNMMISKGLVDAEQFRVLWESPPIPHGPYVYNKNLCQPYLKSIRQAAFDLHHTDRGKEMLSLLGALRFAPAKAKDYDIIRELAKLRQ